MFLLQVILIIDPNNQFIVGRDIEPGEEITYDYATSETYYLKFKECRCDSPHCRKILSVDDWKYALTLLFISGND